MERPPKPKPSAQKGHLKNGDDEKTGSQAYVPPDVAKDKQLIAAVDLLHGVKKAAAIPVDPAAAKTTAPSDGPAGSGCACPRRRSRLRPRRRPPILPNRIRRLPRAIDRQFFAPSVWPRALLSRGEQALYDGARFGEVHLTGMGSFRAATTLPISLMLAAPVCAIAFRRRFSPGNSSICFGKNSLMMAISALSCSANSWRPACW